MDNRINIIESISYTKCADVTSYLASQSGKVKIETRQWHKFPITPGRSSFDISKPQPGPAGRIITANLNISLNQKTTINDPVIVKVEFCESPSLIIGSLDLPVHIETTDALVGKKAQINHSSWHYPHEYTL